MSNNRKASNPLRAGVERLLAMLLVEAQDIIPQAVDADGKEVSPARPRVPFAERLKLAQTITDHQATWKKIDPEADDSELANILKEFHGDGSRTTQGGRKARPGKGVADGGAHGGTNGTASLNGAGAGHIASGDGGGASTG